MGDVWACAMMKDEHDVAEHVIRHMAEEGMRGIIVADHGSTDGTRELLEKLTTDSSITDLTQLVVVDDPEPAYYQSDKMTALARRAAESHGAEWIVPFDADEIWVTLNGERVGDFLSSVTSCNIVSAGILDHKSTVIDERDDNPFTRMKYRKRDATGFKKVAFRWREDAVILMGNHGVEYENSVHDEMWNYAMSALVVRHFPYRSSEQLARKAVNGGRAYEQTDLPEIVGAHWREMHQAMMRGYPAVGIYDRYHVAIVPSEEGLIKDPAPFRRWAE